MRLIYGLFWVGDANELHAAKTFILVTSDRWNDREILSPFNSDTEEDDFDGFSAQEEARDSDRLAGAAYIEVRSIVRKLR